MRVTMTEIARRVGVSVGVVSRLLRDDPTLSISKQRRKQILDEVKKAGGIEVRPRRKQQTRVILVPISDLHSPQWLERNRFTGQRWGMFRKTAEAAGFSVHVSFFTADQRREVIPNLLRRPRQCDGVLLLEPQLNEHEAGLLWAEAFPHVGFGKHEERIGLNSVRANLEEGIRKGMMHLREMGHRRIAFVGSRTSESYVHCVAAMAACGLPIDQSRDCVHPSLAVDADLMESYGRTYEYAARWLAQSWPANEVTALAAEDDRVACAMIQAMVDRGLKPGVDLSVMGCGNQLAKDIHPQGRPACGITTVDNPFGLVGRRAAQRLLNQILHNQTDITHERIPAQLIVRESTGPAGSP